MTRGIIVGGVFRIRRCTRIRCSINGDLSIGFQQIGHHGLMLRVATFGPPGGKFGPFSGRGIAFETAIAIVVAIGSDGSIGGDGLFVQCVQFESIAILKVKEKWSDETTMLVSKTRIVHTWATEYPPPGNPTWYSLHPQYSSQPIPSWNFENNNRSHRSVVTTAVALPVAIGLFKSKSYYTHCSPSDRHDNGVSSGSPLNLIRLTVGVRLAFHVFIKVTLARNSNAVLF